MARRKTGKTQKNGSDGDQTETIAAEDAPISESSEAATIPEAEMAASDLQDELPADVLADADPAKTDEIETAKPDADPASDTGVDASADASSLTDEETAPSVFESDLDEAEQSKDPIVSDDTESDITVVSATDEQESDAGSDSGEGGSKSDPDPVAPVSAVPPAPAQSSGPGFLALAFGGLIAGGIGWAIATFTAPPPPETVDPARLAEVEADLREIEGQVADIPAPESVDLSPLETAQADLLARLDDMAIRIEALELSSSQENGSAGAEVLAGLRDELATIAGSLESAVGDLTPRLEALEAQAAEFDDAEAEAEAALRRAAQNEIAIAVRDGLPYADAAAALEDLPDVLAANAQTGVPPKPSLTEGFGNLAREALAQARTTGTAEGGLGAFARSLVNARSLSPREGNDPDAVLSRVEAAVRAGDLETALAEIEALPPEAAAVLSDWSARARTRVEAEAALQDYLEG